MEWAGLFVGYCAYRMPLLGGERERGREREEEEL